MTGLQIAQRESEQRSERAGLQEALGPLLERITQAETALKELRSTRDEHHDKLEALARYLNEARLTARRLAEVKSAGGPVGAQVSPERYVSGLPIATGTIMLTAQASDPDGWLYCDGTEHRGTDFPELYAVIGTTYGIPSAEGLFKVPSDTHTGGPPHASLRWIMRT